MLPVWLLASCLAILTPATESHELDCNFNQDFCQWQKGTLTPEAEWDRAQKVGGITADHGGDGSFAYIKQTRLAEGHTVKLTSPRVTTGQSGGCLQFYYHIQRKNTGNISVHTLDSAGKTQELSTFTASKDDWKMAEVPLPKDLTNVQIQIHAVSGAVSYPYRYTAVDDTFFKDQCSDPSATNKPDPTPTSPSTMMTQDGIEVLHHCDFETDTCRWDIDYARYNHWHRVNATPPKIHYAGPDFDHTTGDGSYMYFDTTKGPQFYGSKLRSPWLQTRPSSGGCLQFFYYMFGSGVGELRVNMEERISPVVSRQVHLNLWSRGGNRGNAWREGRLDIPAGKNILIEFNATYGNDLRPGIGLDDITVYASPCQDVPVQTTAVPQRTSTVQELFTIKELLDCDFEKDFCSWREDRVDIGRSPMWFRRHSDSSANKATGPSVDHTSGNGTFAVFDSSYGFNGDDSTLYSPEVNTGPTGGCLRFYLHMHGPGVGELSVDRKRSFGAGPNSSILFSSDQGNVWREMTMDLEPEQTIKVRFIATVGRTALGNIGLDDITYFSMSCAELRQDPFLTN